jgi:hypothetical protein
MLKSHKHAYKEVKRLPVLNGCLLGAVDPTLVSNALSRYVEEIEIKMRTNT